MNELQLAAHNSAFRYGVSITSKTVNSPKFKDVLLLIINCPQGRVCYKSGPGNGRDRVVKRVGKNYVSSVPVIKGFNCNPHFICAPVE